jgi:hypothetical protein
MSIAKRLLEQRRNISRGIIRNNTEGPYDIEMSSESITAAYHRRQDTQAMEEYNAKLKAFWTEVQSDLRASADLMIRKNKYLGKSIKPNLYYEDGEIYKLGFSFRPEGVYIHKGVGRGYVAAGNGVVKTSRTPGFNRRPIVWFNPVIERNLPKLREIVLQYNKDIIINTTRIFIQ